MIRKNKKRKGQSTIEYIVLVTGVIAVLIAFLGTGGIFNQAFCQTLQMGTNGMEDMANRLATSRYDQP